MMIEQFIDRLEQQGLLDKEVVEDLRRKVSRTKGKKVTFETIAKYLVDKGHLTRFQATKLVNDATSLPEGGLISDTPRRKSEVDELTLLPDDDSLSTTRETRLQGKEPASKKPAIPLNQELDALTAIDEDLFGEKPSAPTRPDRAAAERLAAAKAAADKAAAERAAAEKAASDRLAAEKIAAERRAAEKAAAERLAAEQAAQREREAKSKRKTEPTTSRREPAPAIPPVPPPPRPPVEPVITDLAADLEGSDALVPGRGRYATAQRKLQKSSEWDSMLLLVGGASLGVLLIVGGFLYFSLTRGAAEDMFGAAETAYVNESYSQAVKLYDKYLEVHPRHEKAGLARVKRQVARLRQVYKSPDQGLKVAQEVLPTIETEEAFPEVRGELASMLPQIARGFVDQAMLSDDSTKKAALLSQTGEAMKLVDNPVYIPTTLRNSQQTVIATIGEDVARVQREIDREKDLNQTVDTINASVTSGDTKSAYEAREWLLNKYPGLDNNELLHEAVVKISEKQREQVQLVSEPLAALTDDPATPAGKAVVLSHTLGQAIGGVADYVVYVLAGGSIFALDASQGNVLWRRYVGVQTTSQPQSLSDAAPLSDAIAVDQRTQEVMRLEAKTGKLRWRLPIGEPFADPVLLDDQIFVAARSGKLYVVDAETGDAAAQVVLPQSLDTGPGVTDRRACFYQLGDQDNLYVISRDTLQCEEVFYIGHKRGTIAVPPVMAFGFLFVAENAGPNFSYLHIIAIDENGRNLKYAQKSERLQGQVLVPPIVGQRKVLVVTDRRAVELYDVFVDPNNPPPIPVTSAGRNNATDEAPLVSYPLLTGGYMWVANNRFTKYQVQASTGKLPSEWVLDEQDVYLAPLQLRQDVIIHVRRRQSAPGFTVAATRANDKDPSWQTEIAVPARSITIKGDVIESVTARGRLYEVDPAAMERGIITQAKASASRDERLVLALTGGFDLGGGELGFSANQGYNQLVFYRPEGENAGLRLLTLTVPLGDASTEPTPFGGGVLIPLRDGQISLTDLVTGASKVDPFHPEIEAGTQTQWLIPAVSEGGQEFVAGNDRKQLYRVGISDKPQAHLQALGSVKVPEPLVGSLAALDTVLYAVTRSGSDDTLASYELPALKETKSWPLEGRLGWGPQRVGNQVLVATDSQLFCLDGLDQPCWKVPWEHAPIVGRPLLVDQHLLLATEDGMLIRLNAPDGQTVATKDIGEPLTWGPVPYQGRWLVAGKCGVLFDIESLTP